MHSAELSAMQLRLTTIEQRPNAAATGDPWAAAASRLGSRVPSSGGGSSAGAASRPESVIEEDMTALLQKQYDMPIKKRRIICVGGFPHDPDAKLVRTKLDEIKGESVGALYSMVPGRYVSKGKILFSSNASAWALMKRMKNKKFSCDVNGQMVTLWHGFDNSPEEQLQTRRSRRSSMR